MPPDRLHVPGPTTALKVAGSHASIMLTFLSCCDCVVTLDGLAGCGSGCVVIGDGAAGGSESGVGEPVPPLHATARAPNPTRMASRTVIVAPPCAPVAKASALPPLPARPRDRRLTENPRISAEFDATTRCHSARNDHASLRFR